MFGFLIFALVFDLVTKYVIESKLAVAQESDFIPGFMNFVVVHNDGAAWNLFSGMQILLIIITFIFLAIYFWAFFTKKNNSKLLGIASGLLIGGCLGNLYDRIVFGYVRDFLNFQFINFPVFNIADTCLCVGVFLLALYFIFIYPKQNKEKEISLAELGIQTDKHGEIYVEDLDNIKTHGFKLKNAFNLKKLMQYQSKKREKAKKHKEINEKTTREE